MLNRGPRGPRIMVAHPASAAMLGQREYEARLIGALAAQTAFDLDVVAIQSLRGRDGGRRVPLGPVTARTITVQRALTRLIYGRADLIHRLDARLPVAKHEVLTLHDVAPLRFDDEGVWPATATASAQAARAVFTPSEFAAREVRDLLGAERVYAIPNGVDPGCAEAGPLSAAARARLGLSDTRFVLYAGGSSDRKNLEGLALAWRRVLDAPAAAGTQLLVCGPPSSAKERLFGALPDCVTVGYVNRTTLLSLMTSAAAVVVPSLYEGFGLPVLEAMAAGTVVVSARTSALVEVSGEAGILVDPSPEGIAAGLIEALRGTHERRVEDGRRWAARFTWEAAAARHAELYLTLIEAAAPRR